MTQFISFSAQTIDRDLLKIERDQKRIKYGKAAQLTVLMIGMIALGSLAFLSRGSVNAHMLHTISDDAIIPTIFLTAVGTITAKKLTRHFKSHQKTLSEGLTGERLLGAMLSEAQIIRAPQNFLKKFSPETPLWEKKDLIFHASKLNHEQWGKLIRAANEYFKNKPDLQGVEKEVLKLIINQTIQVSNLLLTLDAGLIFHLIDQMDVIENENLKLSLTYQLIKVQESYIYKKDKKWAFKSFRRALIKLFGAREKIKDGLEVLKDLKKTLADVDSLSFKKGQFEELIDQINDAWTNRKLYFQI